MSEGSPISPAFKDPQILAEWMSNAKPWGASKKMTTEQWLSWITGPGWAPSGIMQGGVYVDGVEGTVNALEKSPVFDLCAAPNHFPPVAHWAFFLFFPNGFFGKS